MKGLEGYIYVTIWPSVMSIGQTVGEVQLTILQIVISQGVHMHIWQYTFPASSISLGAP